ncbi:alpha-amylase family glycosyl hydrolase, partial [Planctomycetota bacterium]
MNFLPLSKLGPHTNGSQVHVGILLPGIQPQEHYQVAIRVIHERDQFIQSEPAFQQTMQHSVDPDYGDYWETTVDLDQTGSGKHWGQEGRYVYRFCVSKQDWPNGQEIDWVIDPCAREFGVGRHAAFTYGYQPYAWHAEESQWRTPRQQDLILYEMNIMEFTGDLDRAIDKLDYLQDLGVTGISLMPVTNITDVIDWGYTPVGYLGVDERFGKRRDFQAFVDAAHQRGMAVLVDAIYGHTSSLFPYEYLYSRLPIDNPFMGSFSQDMFAPSVDWTKTLAQDFFYAVNRHWLEVYHIDGFRYDCVPNYWELAPHFRGYASIAYHTYQWIKSQVAADNPAYARFQDATGALRLIQCAEQLEAVKGVLEHTYSTCTWQNNTLSAVEKVAQGQAGALTDLGQAWGAADLPTEKAVGPDILPKAPLQYFENHDHSRFVCQFGTYNPDQAGNALFEQGLRAHWTKVQPY